MFEAIGTFVAKLHAALQSAFESIEKAQQPRQPIQVIIPLSQPLKKSKWERMQQRKMMKETEPKRQRLQPSNSLKTLPSLYAEELKLDLAFTDKPKGESEGMKRQRQQLIVSLQGINAEQREVVKAIKERLGLLVTSFNLPYFITLSDPNIMNSVVFQTIYDAIFKDHPANLTKFNKQLDPIIILKGKLKVYPQAFKEIFKGRNIEQFCIQLEQRLQQIALIFPQAINDRVLDMQLQPILKKLRWAKIYRHSFNTHVQGLMGSYLFLRKGKPLLDEHPHTTQGLEMSDIGLLSDSIRVDSQQEAQIVRYWSEKGKTRIQKTHSKYDYNYTKVLEYLKIDGSMPLTLTNYLHLLTRFQQRLILVQDERNATSLISITQSLTEIERRFDALSNQASVVRDGRSAIRKPTLPQPSISACTPLRVFAKWRSSSEEDGHSVGSIMAKLINKTLPSFQAALSLLLRDYDTQVTMPRKKFQLEMLTYLSEYEIICQKLQEEEEEYRRFIENSGLRTPRKGITLQDPQAPKKQRKAWDVQPVPFNQELPVEQPHLVQEQQQQQGEEEKGEGDGEESQSFEQDWQSEDDVSNQENAEESSGEYDDVMEVEAEGGEESVQEQQQQMGLNSDESSSEGVLDIPVEEEAMEVMGDVVEVIQSKSNHSASFGDLVPIEEIDSDEQCSDSQLGHSPHSPMDID